MPIFIEFRWWNYWCIKYCEFRVLSCWMNNKWNANHSWFEPPIASMRAMVGNAVQKRENIWQVTNNRMRSKVRFWLQYYWSKLWDNTWQHLTTFDNHSTVNSNFFTSTSNSKRGNPAFFSFGCSTPAYVRTCSRRDAGSILMCFPLWHPKPTVQPIKWLFTLLTYFTNLIFCFCRQWMSMILKTIRQTNNMKPTQMT